MSKWFRFMITIYRNEIRYCSVLIIERVLSFVYWWVNMRKNNMVVTFKSVHIFEK